MNTSIARPTIAILGLAAILLLIVATIHYMAYSLSTAQGNTEFSFDPKLALLFVVYYLSWIAVFAAIHYLLTKYLPIYGNKFFLSLFLVGMAAWIPIATFVDGSLTDLIFGRHPRSFFKMLIQVNPLSYFNKFMTYCFVFGGIAVLVYYRLYQHVQVAALEHEKAAAEAKLAAVQQRLSALHSQLAPHFLFNCLNMLSGLARMGQRDQLVFAIARLGEMLRFVSEASREGTIPIDEELEFVKNYVQLQDARFGHKYAFQMDVTGDTPDIACLPFCLHTLVENAYTHSTPTSDHPTKITVQLDSKDHHVRIVVRNNNPSKEDSSKLGIGLKNLNDRMKLLYGDAYELTSVRVEDSYVATMAFPR